MAATASESESLLALIFWRECSSFSAHFQPISCVHSLSLLSCSIVREILAFGSIMYVPFVVILFLTSLFLLVSRPWSVAFFVVLLAAAILAILLGTRALHSLLRIHLVTTSISSHQSFASTSAGVDYAYTILFARFAAKTHDTGASWRTTSIFDLWIVEKSSFAASIRLQYSSATCLATKTCVK